MHRPVSGSAGSKAEDAADPWHYASAAAKPDSHCLKDSLPTDAPHLFPQTSQPSRADPQGQKIAAAMSAPFPDDVSISEAKVSPLRVVFIKPLPPIKCVWP